MLSAIAAPGGTANTVDIQNDPEVRKALGADNLFFDEQLRIGDAEVALNGQL